MASVSYPPALPATLNNQSQLMQDYLLTANVMADGSATSPVCVFQNAQGLSEILVADTASNLTHVYRDSNSESGWNVQTAVSSASAMTVVAGTDPQGLIHSFYIGASGTVYHIAFVNGSWTTATALGCTAESLNLTYQPESNALVAYGVTVDGNILVITEDAATSSWTPVTYPDSLSGTTLQLETQIPGSGWFLFAVQDGMLAWNSITADMKQTGSWNPVSISPGNPSPPTNLSSLVVAPDRLGILLALDQDQNLWCIFQSDWYGSTTVGTFNQITTSMKCASASATPQAANDGLAQVYIVDTDNTLWVLRQTVWDPGSSSEWADPVPLGDPMLMTFTPAGENALAEVYGLDKTTAAVVSLAQDPITTDWTSTQIQQPAAVSLEVSTYRTTLTLNDANGVPMFNTPVSFTASDSCTVWISGVAYSVGPNTPLNTQTDAVGALSITALALGVDTPSYTFTGAALAASTPVVPANSVQSFLGGNGSLNELPAFDANTLLQATGADGQPLAPGLTTDGAAATVTSIQELFALPAAQISGGATGALRNNAGMAGFEIDFSDPHTPVFRSLTAEEVAQRRAGSSPGPVGSIFSDLGHFIGDVWHGVKNFAIKVENAVVDTVNSVINLTLSIGGEILPVLEAAIHDIEDVANAVHTVFAAIGAEVERVVEWLRALFNWDDILNTQQVLQFYMDNAIPMLKNLIATQAAPLVNGFFSGLETNILNNAATLKAKFSDGTTLATLPQSGQTGPPAGGSPPSIWSGAQHSWGFDKARQFAPSATGLDPVQTSTVSGPLQDLGQAFESAIPNFEAAVDDLKDFFSGLVKTPSDLKQLAVADLLTALENVAVAALKFADGVIEALLALVEAVLDALQGFFTNTIQMPLLSELYSTVVHEDLSVSGLISLIAAIPLTIGYKLANNNTPPFTSAQVQQILATSPPSATAVPKIQAGVTATSDPSLTVLFNYLAAGIQGIWAVFDTCLDAVPDVEGILDKVLSAIDVGWPVMEQMIGWPSQSGIPFDIPNSPASQRWNLGMWICSWAPPLIDAALIFVPDDGETGDEGGGSSVLSKFLRYSDPAGKIAECAIGILTLGVAIVASVLGGEDGGMDAGVIASNILGPISYIGQPLRIDSVMEGSAGLTLAIQLLNDFFTGMGCAVAMFAS